MKSNQDEQNLAFDFIQQIELSEKAMLVWENHMSTFCSGRKSAFKLSADLIFNFNQASDSIRIIDIASGYGGWSKFIQDISKTQNVNIELTGMDDSLDRLKVYQDILGESATTIQGNILKTLPDLEKNSNGTFDVALLGWAAHEMTKSQLEQIYISIKQLLKPNGIFLIADFVSVLNPEIEVISTQLTKKEREKLMLDDESRKQEEWLKETNKHNHSHTHSNHQHDGHSRQRKDYPINDHFQLLNNAGFSIKEEVWRYMNSSMIIAVK